MAGVAWGARIREALIAACHPEAGLDPSVGTMSVTGFLAPWHRSDALPIGVVGTPAVESDRAIPIDVDRLVVRLFEQEGQSLVRR